MTYPWQQAQWQQLQQSLAAERLPHALLLTGPTGTGKRDFIAALARALLCEQALDSRTEDGEACGQCHGCQLMDAGIHPDFVLLQARPPKKTTSANPVISIKIEAVRELVERLSTTSQLQGRRIAVIEQADKMVHAAANSLLKTLEEPGEDTVIILHSARPHLIPVTIRSRCQQLAFPLPDTDTAVRWLQQQGIDDAANRLAQASGAPLLAVDEALLDSESRQILAEALQAGLKRQSALPHAEVISKLPKYTALCYCLHWVSDVIRLQTAGLGPRFNPQLRKTLARIAEQADSRRLHRFHDQLCDAIRQESIALNSQLLWESLLISWDEVQAVAIHGRPGGQ